MKLCLYVWNLYNIFLVSPLPQSMYIHMLPSMYPMEELKNVLHVGIKVCTLQSML